MRLQSPIIVVALLLAMVPALVGSTAAPPPPLPSADQPQAAICLPAAPSGVDLLSSPRCSADTLPYRLGYTPDLASLPDGRPVYVEPDGSCSGIPDRPLEFDFRDACRRHDLGYDLIRVRWVDASAKPRIDRELVGDMLAACSPEVGIRGLLCRAMAAGAWVAVSLTPTPRDPDPGSFSDTNTQEQT